MFRNIFLLIVLGLSALTGTANGYIWQADLAHGKQGTRMGIHDAQLPNQQSPGRSSVLAGAIHFDHLTTEDGLSQSRIFDILQDQQGYMWFATESGLNKYDGYTFTVYRYDPADPDSLRDDYILTLFEDQDGVLWAGTRNGWLERYDREKDQFTHDFLDFEINDIYIDREGRMWIFSYGAMYEYDRAAQKLNYVLNVTFLSTKEDSQGNFWLGGTSGFFYLYERETKKNQPIPMSIPIEAYAVTEIIEDSMGYLWIGRYGGGISRFEPKTRTFTHYRHDDRNPNSLNDDFVSSMVEDHAGYLWIGTVRGLDYFDISSGQFTHYANQPGDPHSLNANDITSLYIDRTGILWIGTFSSGINTLDLLGRYFFHTQGVFNSPGSLIGNQVQEILVDRENLLWVGTNAGLNRYDPASGSWRYYYHVDSDALTISNNNILCIYEDEQGELWIGSQGGLDRYDRETDSFIRIFPVGWHVVQSIIEKDAEFLWVGTSDGLIQFDPQKDTRVEIQTSYRDFTVLFKDSAGWLWTGTDGDGIWLYDGVQFRLITSHPENPQSLSSNWINTIIEDSTGTVWIGTTTGLNRFNRQEETYQRYFSQDGLPNNVIQSILEDDQGYLWLSTLGGLSRFDPKTETFWNFDVTNGLQSNDFSPRAAFKDKNGWLYFGGYNGYNVFLPEQIKQNKHIPPVIITKMSLYDKVIRKNLPDNESISFSPTENSLSFEFSALDFYSPEKNQYAYKMEGLDADWVNSGTRRFAEYRNLPPGSYVFRVKGSNNDGVWNEQGASVRITIAPPFWQTWWFISLVIAAIGLASIGGYELRVRSVRARSRELEVQVEIRTAELTRANELLAIEMADRARAEEALAMQKAEAAVSAERSRLGRDLHDSVSQSLYAVTLYAEAVTRQMEMGNTEETKSLIQKLHTTALEALGEMRLLVFELRPPILEQAGLAAALQERLEVVEKRAGKSVQLSIEGDIELPMQTQEVLYRVAQEALNNSLKHSQAKSIRIALKLDSQRAVLEIIDDGIGFEIDEVQNRGGLGLRIMSERVQQLGGILTVDGKPGQGTSVRVQIEVA